MDRLDTGSMQLSRECQGVTHAKPELDVELTNEREEQKCRMRNAPRHPSTLDLDSRDLVVGEQIVRPFLWCTDHK